MDDGIERKPTRPYISSNPGFYREAGPGDWLRAQAAHDTEVAEVTLAKTLKKIRPWSQSQTQASMEHTA